MKTCYKCKQEKEMKEFNRNKTKKDGLSIYCRICSRQFTKGHYRRNKTSYLENTENNKNSLRYLINRAKERPCADCGVRYPHFVMDFDHLVDKKFNIGGAWCQRGRKQIEAELNKCEVVCANCHRVRTHSRRG